MDDLTLAVKLKLDSSNISSEAKKVSNNLKGTADGVDSTNAAVDELANALQRITGFNFKNLISSFKDITIATSQIKIPLENTFKDLNVGFEEVTSQLGNMINDLNTSVYNLTSSGKVRFGDEEDLSYMEDQLLGMQRAMDGITDSGKALNDALKTITGVDFNLKNLSLNPTLVHDAQLLKKILSESLNTLNNFGNSVNNMNTARFKQMMGSKADIFNLPNFDLETEKKKVEQYREFLSLQLNTIQSLISNMQGIDIGLSDKSKKSIEEFINNYNLEGAKNSTIDYSKTWEALTTKIKKGGKAIAGFAKTAVGGITIAIAVVILLVKAIKAVIKNAQEVAALGDQIDKTSQKVGMSTSAYQKWTYILNRCGIAAEKLKESMKQLNNSVQSSTKQTYFEQLGISNASSLTQEELFNTTILQLQKVTDKTKRARIATQLFGESASELAPLLNMTNKELKSLSRNYDVLGSAMSDNLVSLSAEYTDATTDLKEAFQGLKNELAEVFLPLMTTVKQSMTLNIVMFRNFWKALRGKSLVSSSLENAADSAEGLNDTLKETRRLISGFDELNVFSQSTEDTIDLTTLTQTGEQISKFEQGLSVVAAAAQAFGKKVRSIFSDIGTWIAKAVIWILDIPNKIGDLLSSIVMGIGNFVRKIPEFSAQIAQYAVNLWDNIKSIFGNVGSWFTNNVWNPFINSIKDGRLFQAIVGVWNSIVNWWNSSIRPIFTKEYWSAKWECVTSWWQQSKLYSAITGAWSGISNWWRNSVAPKFTISYWQSLFNAIPNALSRINLANAAKTMLNGLISAIESGINKIVDALNGSGINTVLKKIGINVTLSRVSIPRLAKGGVIDQPTYALMGEYAGARTNPEIVAPQSILQETINASNDELANVFIQCCRQLIDTINSKDTNVYLNDSDIASAASRGNLAYRKMTGMSLI